MREKPFCLGGGRDGGGGGGGGGIELLFACPMLGRLWARQSTIFQKLNLKQVSFSNFSSFLTV